MNLAQALMKCIDPKSKQICPFLLQRVLWPSVVLYKDQREIIDSVWNVPQTIVPAGNKLGKDYVSALICLLVYLSRPHCRIVTSSVDHSQLEKVLWGELREFISGCSVDLKKILKINHMDITKPRSEKSYLIGRVAKDQASLQGHHLATGKNGSFTTMAVFDEASGVQDDMFHATEKWRHRLLVIGNTYPCTNFFYRTVIDSKTEGTEVPHPSGKGLLRKVIHIRAEDSPNVRLGLAQQRAGKEPTNEVLIPGVKTYYEYLENKATWTKRERTIGLNAEFYEGEEEKMFPELWRHISFRRYELLARHSRKRKAKAIGIDPAEGGDNTVWCIIDEYGVMPGGLISAKTPNTAEIAKKTLKYMRQYNVPPSKVCFDRGGGGKQIADQLRDQGFDVQTVGFGEGVRLEKKRGMHTFRNRINADEERTVYRSRRVQMYWMLREAMSLPNNSSYNVPEEKESWEELTSDEKSAVLKGYNGFAIPNHKDLQAQLKVFPVQQDSEGTYILPPKNHPPTSKSKEATLVSMIGHSPDEADALVMALYILKKKSIRSRAGA